MLLVLSKHTPQGRPRLQACVVHAGVVGEAPRGGWGCVAGEEEAAGCIAQGSSGGCCGLQKVSTNTFSNTLSTKKHSEVVSAFKLHRSSSKVVAESASSRAVAPMLQLQQCGLGALDPSIHSWLVPPCTHDPLAWRQSRSVCHCFSFQLESCRSIASAPGLSSGTKTVAAPLPRLHCSTSELSSSTHVPSSA